MAETFGLQPRQHPLGHPGLLHLVVGPPSRGYVATSHGNRGVLRKWHERTGTPVWALAVQGFIALCLILAFRGYIDATLYTAAVYAFYLGTSLSVIVLRFREPDVERPYKVTGYPVTPLIFSAVCAFLIYSSLNYTRAARPKSLVVLAVMLVAGILIYLFIGTRKTDVQQP